MLKTYFRIASRNLLKRKAFSAINILGLAIGISASLVIYLLVQYDFSFDTFHKDSDRIYRMVSHFTTADGQHSKNSGVPGPMGPALRHEMTGLEEVADVHLWDDPATITAPAIRSNQPVIFKKQQHIVFADEHYFNIFNYQWLAGAPQTALQQPWQVVLTASKAMLYFPGIQPTAIIGRELYLNDTLRLTVTGIIKDLDGNTDLNFTTFIARATLETTNLQPAYWTEWNSTTGVSQLFVKLAAGTVATRVESHTKTLFHKHHQPEPDEWVAYYRLQPLHELHFDADYYNYNQRIAHKPTLYGLLAIAAFLLLLGAINFTNLSTAQASQRAKEIGIRKTLGSAKTQLIVQFLSETFLLTLVATVLSVLITPLLLTIFAAFVPEGLHFSLVQQPGILLFLVTLMVLVTLLAGFYPALVLSGYKPVLVLKNQAFSGSGQTRSAWLRKTLTVSQFVIAQVFIMFTILVGRQISYSLNKDMGFRKEAIVHFNINYHDPVRANKLVLLNKMAAIPEIAMVSLSNNPPSSSNVWSRMVKYKDGKKEINTTVQLKVTDTNYIKLYGLKLLAGQNITQSDTVTQLLINETYTHILGFQQPQDAIGKYIDLTDKQVPVTGVVADFHDKSLHEVIKPLIIANSIRNAGVINVLLQPQNTGASWKTAIQKMERVWKELYPEEDFQYYFLDQQIAKYYEAEQHIATLLIWATGLAIFISCLGLLGLVIYITSTRVKEVGIRKILGATVAQLVTLLSKDFMALVILAFVIATPLAWIGMHQWLKHFAYRTHISLWIFVLSAAIMVLVALFTLGFQTIRAALANPVKSLRSE